MKFRLIAIAVIAASLLTLSACGSSASKSAADSPTTSIANSPAATGPHNQADITFATDMVPHHGQAIVMAGYAIDNATNAEVSHLAQDVKNAQEPEITDMSGWLRGWNAPVPSASASASMMATGTAVGMMSDSDMMSLQTAHGTTFDRMWVQMMTQHHKGAIAMAKTELSDGQNAEAKRLAQAIIDGQTAQITQMNSLMTTLPS